MTTAAGDYKTLLDRFLRDGITADEFQRLYLEKFKNETRELDENLFQLLDELFADVDAFASDPKLLAQLQAERPGFYLDEPSLRNRVTDISQRLAQLQREETNGSGR